jgi:Phytanoyl-CoA dioxygenase (PhyH)
VTTFPLRYAFRRKALTKPNLLYFLWRYIGNGRRTLKARSARSSFPDAAQIAQHLGKEGIVFGPSENFLSKDGVCALAEASVSILEISRKSEVQATIAKGNSDYKKSYLVNLLPWDHAHALDSPLIRLAVDRKLLETVSLYLGLWPRLHAIGAWLNFPTKGEAAEAQLWHRDPEDLRLIKVFIYLNDVNQDRGPFCYIPRTHPFSEGAAIIPNHTDSKRITDEEMQRTFPSKTWLSCTGPAKTMILADTVGYHRGGKPTEGNRILVTFTYTSGTPLSKRRLQITGEPRESLTDIQRQAL